MPDSAPSPPPLATPTPRRDLPALFIASKGPAKEWVPWEREWQAKQGCSLGSISPGNKLGYPKLGGGSRGTADWEETTLLFP